MLGFRGSVVGGEVIHGSESGIGFNSNILTSKMMENRGRNNTKVKSDQPSKTKLLFYYTNARSIRNKLDDFKLELIEKEPDIVGITETWLSDNDSNHILDDIGYEVIRRDRVDRKGGGVLLMIKSGIPYETDNTMAGLVGHHFESVWCSVKLGNYQLKVGVCYRSGATNDDDLLKQALNSARSKAIVLGDFNYPDIDWVYETAKSSVSNKFIELLRENFMIQNVKEATRQDRVLDLVLSSSDLELSGITLTEPLGESDHSVITGEIKCSRPTIVRNHEGWNYKKADFKSISAKLHLINWDSIFRNKDIDDSWLTFKNEVLNLMAQFIPRVKFKNKKGVEWMTKTLLKEISFKKRLWKIYKDKGDNELYEKFREQAKIVKASIKKVKAEYEERLSKNSKFNPKGIFRYIVKKKNNYGDLAIKGDNNELISEPYDIAKRFNDYFSSIFIENTDAEIRFLPRSTEDYVEVTEKEVLEYLLKVNPNKSGGLDGITSILVRNCAESMVKPVTKLFNQSIKVGRVPEDWKLAMVTPIHKGGNKSDICNYRPVSLTPVLSKVMEKIIRERIQRILDDENIISGGQHGFVKGRSCLTNLLTFYENVTRELDKGSDYIAIYLDFRKAFDTVNQRRLVTKLKDIEIPNYICKWIEHWLIDRHQKVVFRGKLSNSCEVKSGVPQGSVLGPTLFNIYINDITSDIKSKILLFADDIKLGRSINDLVDYEILQDDLNKLHMWSTKWGLEFNTNKCKVVHFGRKRMNYDFMINGITLEYVSEYKDLGILVDQKLKFRNHIGKITARAQRSLGLIKSTFASRRKEVLLPLYKTLIRPVLDYGAQLWSPRFKMDINAIEGLQRRLTKCLTGLYNKEYDERLNICELQSLKDRRIRGDMIEIFKMINGRYKINIEDMIKPYSGRILRGHNKKIKREKFKTDLRASYFTVRASSKWNELGSGIVNAKDLLEFKKEIDRTWNFM